MWSVWRIRRRRGVGEVGELDWLGEGAIKEIG